MTTKQLTTETSHRSHVRARHRAWPYPSRTWSRLHKLDPSSQEVTFVPGMTFDEMFQTLATVRIRAQSQEKDRDTTELMHLLVERHNDPRCAEVLLAHNRQQQPNLLRKGRSDLHDNCLLIVS